MAAAQSGTTYRTLQCFINVSNSVKWQPTPQVTGAVHFEKDRVRDIVSVWITGAPAPMTLPEFEAIAQPSGKNWKANITVDVPDAGHIRFTKYQKDLDVRFDAATRQFLRSRQFCLDADLAARWGKDPLGTDTALDDLQEGCWVAVKPPAEMYFWYGQIVRRGTRVVSAHARRHTPHDVAATLRTGITWSCAPCVHSGKWRALGRQLGPGL
jgi:hypothetical protein